MANPASNELVTVERFGMIDEASGHEPLYWGRTNGLAPHGISGEEYVRYTDYAALLARAEAAEAELTKRAEPVAANNAEVYAAALAWCGQKDRETFPEDIEYFKQNWSALPGLGQFVEAEIAKRITAAGRAALGGDNGQ